MESIDKHTNWQLTLILLIYLFIFNKNQSMTESKIIKNVFVTYTKYIIHYFYTLYHVITMVLCFYCLSKCKEKDPPPALFFDHTFFFLSLNSFLSPLSCREPQPSPTIVRASPGPEAAMHPSPLYEWMGVSLVTGNEAVVTARARRVGWGPV